MPIIGKTIETNYIKLSIVIKEEGVMSAARTNKAYEGYLQVIDQSMSHMLNLLRAWEKENEEKILEAGR